MKNSHNVFGLFYSFETDLQTSSFIYLYHSLWSCPDETSSSFIVLTLDSYNQLYIWHLKLILNRNPSHNVTMYPFCILSHSMLATLFKPLMSQTTTLLLLCFSYTLHPLHKQIFFLCFKHVTRIYVSSIHFYQSCLSPIIYHLDCYTNLPTYLLIYIIFPL